MISSESSGWPKDLSLHRKLSLQKHSRVQIRNPVTRKYHECSLIDSGTEEYLKKVEAKGAKLISNMQETLLDLSVSFANDENDPPEPSKDGEASDDDDLSADADAPDPIDLERPPPSKRPKIVKSKPIFEQSPVMLNDRSTPSTSTPCTCDNVSKVSSSRNSEFTTISSGRKYSSKQNFAIVPQPESGP